MSSKFQNFWNMPYQNSLVKRLLGWRQSDEEETWSNKALEALNKKLKRNPDNQYENWTIAMRLKSENSPCVTLSRSQDGRLQVSHRKMLPHVMCCRITRWPDLQSHHELRSIPSCQHPAQKREAAKICVNPYHYTRVDHSLYPPVVTPRNNAEGEFSQASPPPQSPLSNYSSQPDCNSPPYFDSQQQSSMNNQMPQPAHHQAFKQDNQSDSFNYFNSSQNLMQHQQPNQSQQLSGLNFYPNRSPSGDAPWHGSPARAQGEQYNSVSHIDAQSSPPPGYSSRDQQVQRHSRLVPMSVDEHQNGNRNNQNYEDADENQEHWCRITYAELNQKIGEPFKGSSPEVIVDGFTDPSVHNRRFSLGVLSNINRNSTIEMTRRAIRRGVCLENTDKEITIKNLSESSIFFHSKNCNVENQLNQHAVVKIEPQGRLKIFDQKVFEDLVQEAIRSHDGKTFERLFSLTEHCIIKVSFVKGWGSIYQRQDVTSTPCWIEIHLLKPYALIDQYLQQVKPPTSQITSTS